MTSLVAKAGSLALLLISNATHGVLLTCDETRRNENLARADSAALRCTGPYKGGAKPSPEALANIIERQRLRLQAMAAEPQVVSTDRLKAEGENLCEADLSGADLRGQRLSGMSFAGANLANADLRNARIRAADFSRANLYQANMTNSDLLCSTFYGARLTLANLTSATASFVVFRNADLKAVSLAGANLHEADFGGANLIDVNMKGIVSWNTNVANATFGIKKESLPDFRNLWYLNGLSEVKVVNSAEYVAALYGLREELRNAGLTRLERQVTTALKRMEARDGARLERWFNFIAFDLTTEYGTSPGRCLIGVLLISLFATAIYLVAIVGRFESGIWAVWPQETLDKKALEVGPARITLREPFPFARASKARKSPMTFWQWPEAFLMAMYFSVLSAFHIGWRDLNVGSWITRIQPREYSLRATGWARTVSGIQSLLSVYLIALWALTYFGRPFE